jgi:hypothetical protein
MRIWFFLFIAYNYSRFRFLKQAGKAPKYSLFSFFYDIEYHTLLIRYLSNFLVKSEIKCSALYQECMKKYQCLEYEKKKIVTLKNQFTFICGACYLSPGSLQHIVCRTLLTGEYQSQQ